MQKARRHSINAAPTACRRTVSGSISPFYSKCFSPFLHSTCSLSVFQEYLALEDGPPIFRQDFTCPALLIYHPDMPFIYGAITLYGYTFQCILLNI